MEKKNMNGYYLNMQKILSKKISKRDKRRLEKVVERILDEYGEAIRKLGRH